MGLTRILEQDGGSEAAANPDRVRLEAARRRLRGQYFRRLRRPSNRVRHSSG